MMMGIAGEMHRTVVHLRENLWPTDVVVVVPIAIAVGSPVVVRPPVAIELLLFLLRDAVDVGGVSRHRY